jgi:hypothetical protein
VASTIPLYILDVLNHPKFRTDKRHTIQEIVNFVVDEIETDGAEMLATTYCEGEIALSVTGRDIKCAGHKLSMAGRPYDHGQYIGAIPRGIRRKQVLDHYAVDDFGERYQTEDQVMHKESLGDLSAYSWMVYT